MNNDRFKFRVWDNERNSYVRGEWGVLADNGVLYQVLLPESGTTGLLRVDTHRYTIEQCTGLRDRNGKLIYEGDILENTPAGWTFRVMWNGAAWFAESDEPPLLERLNIIPLGICKVVGNIHEVKDE